MDKCKDKEKKHKASQSIATPQATAIPTMLSIPDVQDPIKLHPANQITIPNLINPEPPTPSPQSHDEEVDKYIESNFLAVTLHIATQTPEVHKVGLTF
jgi:hypothetical protein